MAAQRLAAKRRLLVTSLCLALAGCGHTRDFARRGQEAMNRGDYPQARRELAAAVEQNPGDPALWRQLARAHMRDGALSEARIAIARSDGLRPEDPQTVLLRGQIRMGQGDRAGAQGDALWVAQRATRPRVLQETAILLIRAGQTDRGLAAARRAVETSGAQAAAYTNLAVLAVESRRFDIARQALLDGRARHPKDLPLAQAYAAFLVQTGETDKARAIYRELLLTHPEPGVVHLALALLAHQAADLDEAVDHAEAAVRLAGKVRPDVHFTYVVILRDRGERPRADKELARARRRFPGHPGLASLAASPSQ